MLGLARKLNLLASGGSVTLSSYTQTQRSRARRIYVYSSGRKKLPHRCALALRRRLCTDGVWQMGRINRAHARCKLTLRASGGSETLSSDVQTQHLC
jgi:hypothetical protein